MRHTESSRPGAGRGGGGRCRDASGLKPQRAQLRIAAYVGPQALRSVLSPRSRRATPPNLSRTLHSLLELPGGVEAGPWTCLWSETGVGDLKALDRGGGAAGGEALVGTVPWLIPWFQTVLSWKFSS